MTLSSFDVSTYILFGSMVSKMGTNIGKNCGIGSHATIGYADIGDNVAIANYVSLLSGGNQHNFSDPSMGPLEGGLGEYVKVKVGSRSFIGDRSVVMADVGISSIVAAGSVVAKPVPDFVIVVGNPARVVARRDQ